MAVLDPNMLLNTSFQPKVTNQWVVGIGGVPAFLVHKFNLPNYDNGDITIHHINLYFKIKGKSKWGDITMNLYNPVSPSGAQVMMEWIRRSHESVTGRDGYAGFYKQDITFQGLGPVGDIVEQWILKGAFVKSFNPGSNYDYSDSKEVDLQVTLAVDSAELNF